MSLEEVVEESKENIPTNYGMPLERRSLNLNATCYPIEVIKTEPGPGTYNPKNNLTKPKPKVIPRPQELPREVKANPVPAGLFKKTVEEVEKEKE